MKNFMTLLVVLFVSTLVYSASWAKTSPACPMCSVKGGKTVVCMKCDTAKAKKSKTKGMDLKCCCGSCPASDKATADCREACGMPAKK